VKAASRASDDGVCVPLRVSPGAKKSGVEGVYGEGSVKLKVAASPVDGKANAGIEAFLAKLLGVRKSDVEVVKGTSSRDKTVLVRGSTPEKVEKVLAKHL
jgi:uncharacterized protein